MHKGVNWKGTHSLSKQMHKVQEAQMLKSMFWVKVANQSQKTTKEEKTKRPQLPWVTTVKKTLTWNSKSKKRQGNDRKSHFEDSIQDSRYVYWFRYRCKIPLWLAQYDPK